MTEDAEIAHWMGIAEENIKAFCPSPLHNQLRTPRRDYYEAMFNDIGGTLKKLRSLLASAEKKEAQEYLVSQTNLYNGCWELGTQLKPKRIQITKEGSKGIQEYGYRFVYAVVNGLLLDSKDYVRHSCDNRKCLNPAHLGIGSAQENNEDDRIRKYSGRGARGKGQIV